jgi:hypothetical protein
MSPDSTSSGDIMRYKLTIPARINVLGNPSDANEGDFSTISAAVDIRAGAFVTAAQELVLESLQRDNGGWAIESAKLWRDLYPCRMTASLICSKLVNRLYRYAPVQEKFAQRGVSPLDGCAGRAAWVARRCLWPALAACGDDLDRRA